MIPCPLCRPGFATMAKDEGEERWCAVKGNDGREHGYF